MPLRDRVRVGQIGRRRKDHAEVIDQVSDPAPRFCGRQNVEVRYSGLRGKASGAVDEPAVRLPLRDDPLRQLRGHFGARPDFRQMSLGDALELSIDGLDPLPQPLNLFLDLDDRASLFCGLVPSVTLWISRMAPSTCRRPCRSFDRTAMARGCTSGGNCSFSTARADSLRDTTSTRWPVAMAWQIRLAIVCVFPVPGGPWTTSPPALGDSANDLDLVAVERLRKEHVAEPDLRLGPSFGARSIRR